MYSIKNLTIMGLVCILAVSGCQIQNTNAQTPAYDVQEETQQFSEMDVSVKADDFIRQISVGYNIGNSLDSCPTNGRNNGTYSPSYYETFWGNPTVTADYVDAVIAAGFNTIKVPVTWYYNTYVAENGELQIREEWLERVGQVIDYALNQGLYVILDSHHDEYIIWADMDAIDEVSANLCSLWKQIADYFEDYDYHLVFEGFNEINTKDNSWKYRDGTIEATNILNQCFVDTIRSCGGQNPQRLLICDTYLSSCEDEALSGYVLPTDSSADLLMIGIHCYTNIYDQDMKDTFKTLDEFSKSAGAPVLITEFGTTTDYTPIEYRSFHAGNYISYANDYHIKCFWWDDGKKYSLFNRKTCAVSQSDIVSALMNPTKFHVEKISTKTYNTFKLYTYGILEGELGSVSDGGKGAVTLTAEGAGVSVSPGLGYHIILTASDHADGLRLCGISFYDKQGKLLNYQSVSNSQAYDITAPSEARYMRISIYNPWGYRSAAQYQSYLETAQMQLEITEYIK